MTASFQSMSLDPNILRAIEDLEYETPTPVQVQAIPLLLEGHDVIGQAKTGTGKTAAFAIPLLQSFDERIRSVQGLIVTPTRELAIQVAKVVRELARYMRVRVLTIYGGQSYGKQIRRLQRGVDIVVGTPGRLLDLIQRDLLHLDSVRYVVLDEADEMLSMGFIEDVETILDTTSSLRQTALFSATMPDRVRRLADCYMDNPEIVEIEFRRRTVSKTEQRYYRVEPDQKFTVLLRLLMIESLSQALVFARTKVGAAELAEDLRVHGIRAEALHGDMNQRARERVMGYFRLGATQVLVATDVAARGMDIPGVSHVINYDIPLDPKMYVHRIGRTGRAGRGGVAVSLVIPREMDRLQDIEVYTLEPIEVRPVPTDEEVEALRERRLVEDIRERTEASSGSAQALASHLIDEVGDPTKLASAALDLLWAEYKPPAVHQPGESLLDSSRGPDRDEASRKRDEDMVRLVMSVGADQGVEPGDVVRTVAEQSGIHGRDIGLISIEDRHTYVDIHRYCVDEVLRSMRRFEICGHQAGLRRAGAP